MGFLKKNSVFVLGSVLFIILGGGCSNKVNTWSSRQYHMATTRWNVYFNGKESFLKGQKKIAENHKENFDKLLPVYFENDIPARETASSEMKRAVTKSVKAIDLHSITVKPKRKKGKRNSEKYREFRRKKEYNNMIDECYLLLGKAQFYRREYYSTERTFRYILREFNDLPMHYEAAIWYARTLTEQDKYFRALRTVEDVMEEEGFPEKLIPMARAAKADMYIRRGLYKKAIEELIYLKENTKKSQGQSRYYYLLAQLYSMQGDIEKAQKTYAELIQTHPEYEYVFQAKLSKALLYEEYDNAASDTKVILELKQLVRDGRNKKYLDQVYYTLAKVYEKENELKKAEENYLLSAEHNTTNKKQQAKTLLALGDLYFGNKEYAFALENYKKASGLITGEYPRYEEVITRLESLSKLAENLAIVSVQDSLRKVAGLSTVEREKLIKTLMIAEREAVEYKSKRTKKKIQKSLEAVNRPLGKWYFYNPMAVAQGKKEFQKKWGVLNLTDNWRTKPEEFYLSAEERSKALKDTLKFRSYEEYIADLPLTKKALKESEKKSIVALYDAGVIYEDEMDDYLEAKKSFEGVLKRKPESDEKRLRTIFHLYMLSSLLDNEAESLKYKKLILGEFPDSDLARVLEDPAYYKKMEQRGKDAESLYEKAYAAYSKFDFNKAKDLTQKGMEKYKWFSTFERFAFLNAMTKAYTESAESFKEALLKVNKVATDRKILAATKGLLARLEKREVPNQKVNKVKKRYTVDDFKKPEVSVKNTADIVAKKVRIPKAYVMDAEAKHFVALIVPRDLKLDIPQYIREFNQQKFADDKLRVNRRNFSLNTDIILIDSFSGKDESLVYFGQLLIAEKEFLKAINKVDYKNIIITEKNLLKLTADRDVVPYLDFYSYHYFGEGKELKEEKKEEKEEVNKGTINQSVDTNNLNPTVLFNPDLEKMHNFVLVLPSKGVDVNYLWTALHHFDENFKVKKERLGNQKILIVKGIGTKAEAMKYLKKVINIDYIYGNLKNVKYRNFVITDENLAILRSSKALDNYVQFFKKEYLK